MDVSCAILDPGCGARDSRDLDGPEFHELAGSGPWQERHIYRTRPGRSRCRAQTGSGSTATLDLVSHELRRIAGRVAQHVHAARCQPGSLEIAGSGSRRCRYLGRLDRLRPARATHRAPSTAASCRHRRAWRRSLHRRAAAIVAARSCRPCRGTNRNRCRPRWLGRRSSSRSPRLDVCRSAPASG